MSEEKKEEVLGKENILESEKERFVRWLVIERGISRRIAEMYGRSIVRMLRKLDTMIPTKQQCEAYRDDMLMNGKKNGYVLQVVKAIRHYGRFISRDLTIRYPPREKQKLPTFLTETEIRQMLFGCRSIKEKLVVMLSGACGLRPNEVCRLKISDVNFDTSTISVPTVKTDSRWEIPISNDVIGIIKAYLQYERPNNNKHEELLLDQYNEPYNPINCRGIRYTIKSIGRKAKLSKRIYPTVLRHSYATLLMKNGCPLPYVQRLMRHRNIKSTLVYAHVVEDGLKEIYERYAPLRLTPLTKDQAPYEPVQRLPLRNLEYQQYEPRRYDFDKPRTLNHKRDSQNGYI